MYCNRAFGGSVQRLLSFMLTLLTVNFKYPVGIEDAYPLVSAVGGRLTSASGQMRYIGLWAEGYFFGFNIQYKGLRVNLNMH